MPSIYRLLPQLHQALVWRRGRDLMPLVRGVAVLDDEVAASLGRSLQVTAVAEVAGPAPWTARAYVYPRPAGARRRP